MVKHIYFFIDEDGFSPVEAFINSLTNKERAKVTAYIKILREFGYKIRRPIADYLGNDIYELRPGAHRVFYFFFMNDSIVFIHMIRKKTDKIPLNDLKLCMKRKNEVETLENIKEFNV